MHPIHTILHPNPGRQIENASVPNVPDDRSRLIILHQTGGVGKEANVISMI